MPTRRFNVTTTPQNLCAGLSLVDERNYLVEPVAGHAAARIWEDVSAPTDLSAFHTIPAGTPWTIECQAGYGIWIWCSQSAGSTVVVVSDA